MKSLFLTFALLFSFAFANAAPLQIESRHGRDDRRSDRDRGDYSRGDYGRGDYGRGDDGRRDRGHGGYGRHHDRDYDQDYNQDYDRNYDHGRQHDRRRDRGHGRRDRDDSYNPRPFPAPGHPGQGGYRLPYGSYVNSCHSCNVGPQVMTCVCSNSYRQLFTTSIFYGLCRSIGNFQGQLACE